MTGITVSLFIVLGILGQKPTQGTLPMPDVDTCLAEAARFLAMVPPEGTHISLRIAACKVGDDSPGTDVKQ